MSKNKTKEVIRFEVLRNLKKPSFWISAILIPVLFVGYIWLVGFTSYSATEELSKGSDTDELELGYYDGANYLKINQIATSEGETKELKAYDSTEAGIAALKSGEIGVFYNLPDDLSESKKVTVYAKPDRVGITDDYSMPLRQLLSTSAMANLSELDIAVISDTIEYDDVNFDQDGNEVDKGDIISKMVGPAIAFALFELINMILGGRLANAMVEEKENRISELLLTSIKPIQLISGKIISLMIVGIIQIIILLIPALVLFFVAKERGMLPFDFELALDPLNIGIYVLLTILAYFLITASYVLIGILSPTAKDAGNYAAIFIIFSILPILTLNAFTGTEVSLPARIMTYFPYSSLIASSLRAFFGNLESWELIVGGASMLIGALLITKLATYLYCKNSIDLKLNFNFKQIFGETRKSWKK